MNGNGRNPITEMILFYEAGPGRLMALIADPNPGEVDKRDGNSNQP